ncbi:MAG: CC0125/CC1285 family lipoprotein [Chlamydiia bacterium]
MKNRFCTFVAYVAILITFTACTGYQSEGFWGGYSEITVAPDTFVVTYKGNEYSSEEKIYAYTLRRASELTLVNGYKYFSIVATADQTKKSKYTNTRNNINGSLDLDRPKINASTSSSSYTTTTKTPVYSITIKCHDDRPHSDAIDALYFIQNNPT